MANASVSIISIDKTSKKSPTTGLSDFFYREQQASFGKKDRLSFNYEIFILKNKHLYTRPAAPLGTLGIEALSITFAFLIADKETEAKEASAMTYPTFAQSSTRDSITIPSLCQQTISTRPYPRRTGRVSAYGKQYNDNESGTN